MKSFEMYFMNKQYSRVKELGDKLAEINPLIDWGVFRPIVREMYDNRTERGGRPNIDEIVMIKELSVRDQPENGPMPVIKNIFKSGHLLVTTTLRAHTKNLFTCFCYNLQQLNTLQKKNPT